MSSDIIMSKNQINGKKISPVKKPIAKKTNNKNNGYQPKVYTKLKLKDQILAEPDMYIGKIDSDLLTTWIYENDSMEFKEIEFVEGLYKIFDEILVNARDHSVRDPTCSEIRIKINKENGKISCYNNGENGIPIRIEELEDEDDVYSPELIFSHLLTSENYGQKNKITGGKNGYGAKLTNIFSKYFKIQVCNRRCKKLYIQRFEDNMSIRNDPIISDINIRSIKNSFCKISFVPDYKKFGLKNGLSDDLIAMFYKRVYDIALCTKNVKVYLNDKLLKIGNIIDYAKLFYHEDNESTDSQNKNKYIYEECNDRWEICAIYDTNMGGKCLSFVNGISTFEGGKHVDYIMDQLTKFIKNNKTIMQKKICVKPADIKKRLVLFVNSVIEDPGFDSQCKKKLTTSVKNFGSVCELSENFAKTLCKSGIIQNIIDHKQLMDTASLKKIDGKKNTTIKGITKLEDAEAAGTREAHKCCLIITEGDSAKSLAMDGLKVAGRKYIGVFPVKGKVLNVKTCTMKQLRENKEIIDIIKILGLKHGVKYDNDQEYNKLRYGKIVVFTDQDTDGFHIKGLLMNFIHNFWPELIARGFIDSLATPIVKATKTVGKKIQQLSFYNQTDFINWKNKQQKMASWNIKYYKGLGTSTQKEALEYFTDFYEKLIQYTVKDKEETDKTMTLAFDKKYADERKNWLSKYDGQIVLNNDIKSVNIPDFINKELIHFSYDDCIRSLPNVCDGFKVSQRKILFGIFKKKLKENDEIKVAQLAGYISEKTAYHHGEVSLMGAIINMAQNYVGSNNINLLYPSGQFGTRLNGGKDSAAPRYIFTRLESITKLIFDKLDEPNYKYNDDDGEQVEPFTYAPIVPMILINGSEGIGTGWSTKIPSFNPLDVIKNVKNKLTGKKMEDMTPWYSNFKGKIIKESDTKYVSRGIFEIINNNTIVIKELPIGMWTSVYKEYLESITVDDKNPKPVQIIESSLNNSGTNDIHFIITLKRNEIAELCKKGDKAIYNKFKLESNINLTNMHAFDKNYQIKKYDSVFDIIDDHYEYRLDMYTKRKNYLTDKIKIDLDKINWKIKFLEGYMKKEIKINNRAKDEVIKDLQSKGFPELFDKNSNKNNYNYLTNLPIFSLTKEKLEELRKEHDDKLQLYNMYMSKSNKDLWMDDLLVLESEYKKWYSSMLKEMKENEKIIEQQNAKNTVKKKRNYTRS